MQSFIGIRLSVENNGGTRNWVNWC